MYSNETWDPLSQVAYEQPNVTFGVDDPSAASDSLYNAYVNYAKEQEGTVSALLRAAAPTSTPLWQRPNYSDPHQSPLKSFGGTSDPLALDPDPFGKRTVEYGQQIGKPYTSTDVLSLNVFGREMGYEQLNQSEAGRKLIELTQKNRAGQKRGFLEAISDFQWSDIPFLGLFASVGGSINDAVTVSDTMRKLQNGEKVSDEELIKTRLYIAEQEYNENGTWGATVGDIIRAAPGFMFEFAASGGVLSGARALATKAAGSSVKGLSTFAVNRATKRLGKELAEHEVERLAIEAAGETVARDVAIGKIKEETLKAATKRIATTLTPYLKTTMKGFDEGVISDVAMNIAEKRVAQATAKLGSSKAFTRFMRGVGDNIIDATSRGLIDFGHWGTEEATILFAKHNKAGQALADALGAFVVEAPLRGTIMFGMNKAAAAPLSAAVGLDGRTVSASQLGIQYSALRQDNKQLMDDAEAISLGIDLMEYISENAGRGFGSLFRAAGLASGISKPVGRKLVGEAGGVLMESEGLETGGFIRSLVRKYVGTPEKWGLKNDAIRTDAVISEITEALRSKGVERSLDRTAISEMIRTGSTAKLLDNEVKSIVGDNVNGFVKAALDKSFNREEAKFLNKAYLRFTLSDIMARHNWGPDTIINAYERMGYDGIIGEMCEERYSDFAKGLFGLDDKGNENLTDRIKQAFVDLYPGWDQLCAEAVGFAVPGMTRFAALNIQRRIGDSNTVKEVRQAGRNFQTLLTGQAVTTASLGQFSDRVDANITALQEERAKVEQAKQNEITELAKEGITPDSDKDGFAKRTAEFDDRIASYDRKIAAQEEARRRVLEANDIDQITADNRDRIMRFTPLNRSVERGNLEQDKLRVTRSDEQLAEIEAAYNAFIEQAAKLGEAQYDALGDKSDVTELPWYKRLAQKAAGIAGALVCGDASLAFKNYAEYAAVDEGLHRTIANGLRGLYKIHHAQAKDRLIAQVGESGGRLVSEEEIRNEMRGDYEIAVRKYVDGQLAVAGVRMFSQSEMLDQAVRYLANKEGYTYSYKDKTFYKKQADGSTETLTLSEYYTKNKAAADQLRTDIAAQTLRLISEETTRNIAGNTYRLAVSTPADAPEAEKVATSLALQMAGFKYNAVRTVQLSSNSTLESIAEDSSSVTLSSDVVSRVAQASTGADGTVDYDAADYNDIVAIATAMEWPVKSYSDEEIKKIRTSVINLCRQLKGTLDTENVMVFTRGIENVDERLYGNATIAVYATRKADGRWYITGDAAPEFADKHGTINTSFATAKDVIDFMEGRAAESSGKFPPFHLAERGIAITRAAFIEADDPFLLAQKLNLAKEYLNRTARSKNGVTDYSRVHPALRKTVAGDFAFKTQDEIDAQIAHERRLAARYQNGHDDLSLYLGKTKKEREADYAECKAAWENMYGERGYFTVLDTLLSENGVSTPKEENLLKLIDPSSRGKYTMTLGSFSMGLGTKQFISMDFTACNDYSSAILLNTMMDAFARNRRLIKKNAPFHSTLKDFIDIVDTIAQRAIYNTDTPETVRKDLVAMRSAITSCMEHPSAKAFAELATAFPLFQTERDRESGRSFSDHSRAYMAIAQEVRDTPQFLKFMGLVDLMLGGDGFAYLNVTNKLGTKERTAPARGVERLINLFNNGKEDAFKEAMSKFRPCGMTVAEFVDKVNERARYLGLDVPEVGSDKAPKGSAHIMEAIRSIFNNAKLTDLDSINAFFDEFKKIPKFHAPGSINERLSELQDIQDGIKDKLNQLRLELDKTQAELKGKTEEAAAKNELEAKVKELEKKIQDAEANVEELAKSGSNLMAAVEAQNVLAKLTAMKTEAEQRLDHVHVITPENAPEMVKLGRKVNGLRTQIGEWQSKLKEIAERDKAVQEAIKDAERKVSPEETTGAKDKSPSRVDSESSIAETQAGINAGETSEENGGPNSGGSSKPRRRRNRNNDEDRLSISFNDSADSNVPTFIDTDTEGHVVVSEQRPQAANLTADAARYGANIVHQYLVSMGSASKLTDPEKFFEVARKLMPAASDSDLAEIWGQYTVGKEFVIKEDPTGVNNDNDGGDEGAHSAGSQGFGDKAANAYNNEVLNNFLSVAAIVCPETGREFQAFLTNLRESIANTLKISEASLTDAQKSALTAVNELLNPRACTVDGVTGAADREAYFQMTLGDLTGEAANDKISSAINALMENDETGHPISRKGAFLLSFLRALTPASRYRLMQLVANSARCTKLEMGEMDHNGGLDITPSSGRFSSISDRMVTSSFTQLASLSSKELKDKLEELQKDMIAVIEGGKLISPKAVSPTPTGLRKATSTEISANFKVLEPILAKLFGHESAICQLLLNEDLISRMKESSLYGSDESKAAAKRRIQGIARAFAPRQIAETNGYKKGSTFQVYNNLKRNYNRSEGEGADNRAFLTGELNGVKRTEELIPEAIDSIIDILNAYLKAISNTAADAPVNVKQEIMARCVITGMEVGVNNLDGILTGHKAADANTGWMRAFSMYSEARPETVARAETLPDRSNKAGSTIAISSRGVIPIISRWMDLPASHEGSFAYIAKNYIANGKYASWTDEKFDREIMPMCRQTMTWPNSAHTPILAKVTNKDYYPDEVYEACKRSFDTKYFAKTRHKASKGTTITRPDGSKKFIVKTWSTLSRTSGRWFVPVFAGDHSSGVVLQLPTTERPILDENGVATGRVMRLAFGEGAGKDHSGKDPVISRSMRENGEEVINGVTISGELTGEDREKAIEDAKANGQFDFDYDKAANYICRAIGLNLLGKDTKRSALSCLEAPGVSVRGCKKTADGKLQFGETRIHVIKSFGADRVGVEKEDEALLGTLLGYGYGMKAQQRCASDPLSQTLKLHYMSTSGADLTMIKALTVCRDKDSAGKSGAPVGGSVEQVLLDYLEKFREARDKEFHDLDISTSLLMDLDAYKVGVGNSKAMGVPKDGKYQPLMQYIFSRLAGAVNAGETSFTLDRLNELLADGKVADGKFEWCIDSAKEGAEGSFANPKRVEIAELLGVKDADGNLIENGTGGIQVNFIDGLNGPALDFSYVDNTLQSYTVANVSHKAEPEVGRTPRNYMVDALTMAMLQKRGGFSPDSEASCDDVLKTLSAWGLLSATVMTDETNINDVRENASDMIRELLRNGEADGGMNMEDQLAYEVFKKLAKNLNAPMFKVDAALVSCGAIYDDATGKVVDHTKSPLLRALHQGSRVFSFRDIERYGTFRRLGLAQINVQNDGFRFGWFMDTDKFEKVYGDRFNGDFYKDGYLAVLEEVITEIHEADLKVADLDRRMDQYLDVPGHTEDDPEYGELEDAYFAALEGVVDKNGKALSEGARTLREKFVGCFTDHHGVYISEKTSSASHKKYAYSVCFDDLFIADGKNADGTPRRKFDRSAVYFDADLRRDGDTSAMPVFLAGSTFGIPRTPSYNGSMWLQTVRASLPCTEIFDETTKQYKCGRDAMVMPDPQTLKILGCDHDGDKAQCYLYSVDPETGLAETVDIPLPTDCLERYNSAGEEQDKLPLGEDFVKDGNRKRRYCEELVRAGILKRPIRKFDSKSGESRNNYHLSRYTRMCISNKFVQSLFDMSRGLKVENHVFETDFYRTAMANETKAKPITGELWKELVAAAGDTRNYMKGQNLGNCRVGALVATSARLADEARGRIVELARMLHLAQFSGKFDESSSIYPLFKYRADEYQKWVNFMYRVDGISNATFDDIKEQICARLGWTSGMMETVIADLVITEQAPTNDEDFFKVLIKYVKSIADHGSRYYMMQTSNPSYGDKEVESIHEKVRAAFIGEKKAATSKKMYRADVMRTLGIDMTIDANGRKHYSISKELLSAGSGSWTKPQLVVAAIAEAAKKRKTGGKNEIDKVSATISRVISDITQHGGVNQGSGYIFYLAKLAKDEPSKLQEEIEGYLDWTEGMYGLQTAREFTSSFNYTKADPGDGVKLGRRDRQALQFQTVMQRDRDGGELHSDADTVLDVLQTATAATYNAATCATIHGRMGLAANNLIWRLQDLAKDAARSPSKSATLRRLLVAMTAANKYTDRDVLELEANFQSIPYFIACLQTMPQCNGTDVMSGDNSMNAWRTMQVIADTIVAQSKKDRQNERNKRNKENFADQTKGTTLDLRRGIESMFSVMYELVASSTESIRHPGFFFFEMRPDNGYSSRVGGPLVRRIVPTYRNKDADSIDRAHAYIKEIEDGALDPNEADGKRHAQNKAFRTYAESFVLSVDNLKALLNEFAPKIEADKEKAESTGREYYDDIRVKEIKDVIEILEALKKEYGVDIAITPSMMVKQFLPLYSTFTARTINKEGGASLINLFPGKYAELSKLQAKYASGILDRTGEHSPGHSLMELISVLNLAPVDPYTTQFLADKESADKKPGDTEKSGGSKLNDETVDTKDTDDEYDDGPDESPTDEAVDAHGDTSTTASKTDLFRTVNTANVSQEEINAIVNALTRISSDAAEDTLKLEDIPEIAKAISELNNGKKLYRSNPDGRHTLDILGTGDILELLHKYVNECTNDAKAEAKDTGDIEKPEDTVDRKTLDNADPIDDLMAKYQTAVELEDNVTGPQEKKAPIERLADTMRMVIGDWADVIYSGGNAFTIRTKTGLKGAGSLVFGRGRNTDMVITVNVGSPAKNLKDPEAIAQRKVLEDNLEMAVQKGNPIRIANAKLELKRFDEAHSAKLDVNSPYVASSFCAAAKALGISAEQFMLLTEDERIALLNHYAGGAVRDGVNDFSLSKPSWTLDSYGMMVLAGEINLSENADAGKLFHEYFHSMMGMYRAIGLFTKDDIEVLRNRFGKPTDDVDELFDEESAAEEFRRYVQAKLGGRQKIYGLGAGDTWKDSSKETSIDKGALTEIFEKILRCLKAFINAFKNGFNYSADKSDTTLFNMMLSGYASYSTNTLEAFDKFLTDDKKFKRTKYKKSDEIKPLSDYDFVKRLTTANQFGFYDTFTQWYMKEGVAAEDRFDYAQHFEMENDEVAALTATDSFKDKYKTLLGLATRHQFVRDILWGSSNLTSKELQTVAKDAGLTPLELDALVRFHSQEFKSKSREQLIEAVHKRVERNLTRPTYVDPMAGYKMSVSERKLHDLLMEELNPTGDARTRTSAVAQLIKTLTDARKTGEKSEAKLDMPEGDNELSSEALMSDPIRDAVAVSLADDPISEAGRASVYTPMYSMGRAFNRALFDELDEADLDIISGAADNITENDKALADQIARAKAEGLTHKLNWLTRMSDARKEVKAAAKAGVALYDRLNAGKTKPAKGVSSMALYNNLLCAYKYMRDLSRRTSSSAKDEHRWFPDNGSPKGGAKNRVTSYDFAGFLLASGWQTPQTYVDDLLGALNSAKAASIAKSGGENGFTKAIDHIIENVMSVDVDVTNMLSNPSTHNLAMDKFARNIFLGISRGDYNELTHQYEDFVPNTNESEIAMANRALYQLDSGTKEAAILQGLLKQTADTMFSIKASCKFFKEIGFQPGSFTNSAFTGDSVAPLEFAEFAREMCIGNSALTDNETDIVEFYNQPSFINTNLNEWMSSLLPEVCGNEPIRKLFLETAKIGQGYRAVLNNVMNWNAAFFGISRLEHNKLLKIITRDKSFKMDNGFFQKEEGKDAYIGFNIADGIRGETTDISFTEDEYKTVDLYLKALSVLANGGTTYITGVNGLRFSMRRLKDYSLNEADYTPEAIERAVNEESKGDSSVHSVMPHIMALWRFGKQLHGEALQRVDNPFRITRTSDGKVIVSDGGSGTNGMDYYNKFVKALVHGFNVANRTVRSRTNKGTGVVDMNDAEFNDIIIRTLEADGVMTPVFSDTKKDGNGRAYRESGVVSIPCDEIIKMFEGSSAYAKLIKAGRDPALLDAKATIKRYMEPYRKMVDEISKHSWLTVGDGKFFNNYSTPLPFFQGTGMFMYHANRVARDKHLTQEIKLGKHEVTYMRNLKILENYARMGKTKLMEDISSAQLEFIHDLFKTEESGSDLYDAIMNGEYRKGTKKNLDTGLTLDPNDELAAAVTEIYKKQLQIHLQRMEGQVPGKDEDSDDAIARMIQAYENTMGNSETNGTLAGGVGLTDEQMVRMHGALPANMQIGHKINTALGGILDAIHYRATLVNMLFTPDRDGKPMYYMLPNEFAVEQGGIPDPVWGAVARWWGARNNVKYDPSESGVQNARRIFGLIASARSSSKKINGVVYHELGPDDIDSGSIERVFCRADDDNDTGTSKLNKLSGNHPHLLDGGEAIGYAKHLFQTSRLMGGGARRQWLSRIMSWSKSLSVAYSFFFPIATKWESAVGAVGAMATIGSNLSPEMARKFGKGMSSIQKAFTLGAKPGWIDENFIGFKDIIKMMDTNDPFLGELMMWAESLGITMSNSLNNPMEPTKGFVASDIRTVVDRVRSSLGSKAASRVDAILSTMLLRSGEKAFTYALNATKLAITCQIATKLRSYAIAKGKAFDPIRDLSKYAEYIDTEIGGINPFRYSWSHPMMRGIMNCALFSWEWTRSAWEAGGGHFFEDVLFGGHSMSKEMRHYVLGRWLRMFGTVMIGVPVMAQLLIKAFAHALGEDDDDDKWFTWQNEDKTKWTAFNLTPLMKVVDKYEDTAAIAGLIGGGVLGLRYAGGLGAVGGAVAGATGALPRYTGKDKANSTTRARKYYMHFGKQGWEFFRWFTAPTESFFSKLSMPTQRLLEGIFGRNLSYLDRELPFSEQSAAERWLSLSPNGATANLLKAFVPFTINGITTFSDAGMLPMIGPVSMGASKTNISDRMKASLAAWAENERAGYKYGIRTTSHGKKVNRYHLVNRLSDIMADAKANGVHDPEELMVRAIGQLCTRYYARIFNALPENPGDKFDVKEITKCVRALHRLGIKQKSMMNSVKKRLKMQGREWKTLTGEQKSMYRAIIKSVDQNPYSTNPLFDY